MNTDEASEKLAVELAAHGVIGKRVDEMETGFMMALDYMIEVAEKDQDDKVNISTFVFAFTLWRTINWFYVYTFICIYSGELSIRYPVIALFVVVFIVVDFSLNSNTFVGVDRNFISNVITFDQSYGCLWVCHALFLVLLLDDS